MLGFKFLGNTHVPHKKNTAGMQGVKITPPAEVLLPILQNIGAPATILVKKGDTVKIGQKIAEAEGFVSSPVYATVSGTVVGVEPYMRPTGIRTDAIRIQSDGLMTLDESIKPPVVNDLDSFIAAVRESGVVGLGGAGFPTAVKLAALKTGNIDTIVINGAECEPHLTSDTATMLYSGELIKEGIALLEKYASVSKYAFAVEKNKPECIKKLRELFADNAKVEVSVLPALYPQGAEKVTIYNTTKRVVPEGKLPADVGVLVINVTTLAKIAEYIATGMPLVEKCITVDGTAIASPKNVIAPIGTSIKDVIEFVGGTSAEVGKVVFGGPMMGIAAESISEPVAKTTNGITVFADKDAYQIEPTACIHCGRCVSACPLGLNPIGYARALNIESKEDRMARLEAERVNICMECGCCSYVCPAHRPLVQNNKICKAELKDYKAHKQTLEN